MLFSWLSVTLFPNGPSRIYAILFWLFTMAIAYTYVGYPALLWLISKFQKPSLPAPSDAPTITLLICAHNEAKNIARKLRESLALNYPRNKLQILVASDGSTDETVEIVRSFAERGVELIVVPQQGGKTNAQNIAVPFATGDIIVFSDATTQYHRDALRYLAGNFADPATGAVSGRYCYFDPDAASPTGEGARAFAGYDNRIRQMQSQISSITGCCGCIYAVRRALYTPLPTYIISDFVEPLHVLLRGAKAKLEPRAVAHETSTSTSRKEFSMRVRVVARSLHGLNNVRPLLNPLKYPWIALQLYSHKVFRYSIPVFLIVVLLSSALLFQLPFYRAVFCAQVLLYAAALVAAFSSFARHIRLLRLPLYFCILNAAALAGLLQFLRGQRYVAWKPEREASHAH